MPAECILRNENAQGTHACCCALWRCILNSKILLLNYTITAIWHHPKNYYITKINIFAICMTNAFTVSLDNRNLNPKLPNTWKKKVTKVSLHIEWQHTKMDIIRIWRYIIYKCIGGCSSALVARSPGYQRKWADLTVYHLSKWADPAVCLSDGCPGWSLGMGVRRTQLATVKKE